MLLSPWKEENIECWKFQLHHRQNTKKSSNFISSLWYTVAFLLFSSSLRLVEIKEDIKDFSREFSSSTSWLKLIRFFSSDTYRWSSMWRRTWIFSQFVFIWICYWIRNLQIPCFLNFQNSLKITRDRLWIFKVGVEKRFITSDIPLNAYVAFSHDFSTTLSSNKSKFRNTERENKWHLISSIIHNISYNNYFFSHTCRINARNYMHSDIKSRQSALYDNMKHHQMKVKFPLRFQRIKEKQVSLRPTQSDN
jgi:hypothetical protein